MFLKPLGSKLFYFLRFIFMRDSDSNNNVMITLKNKNQHEYKYLVPDGKLLSESAYIELEPGL